MLALEGADRERIGLPCGEGRCKLNYPSEEDQVCTSISPENQKDAGDVLIKGKQVLSTKSKIAKGVVQRFDTGGAHLQVVSPYRGRTYPAKL